MVILSHRARRWRIDSARVCRAGISEESASLVPMIQLNKINKVYRTGDVEVQALRDVSLTIEPGEFVAVTGPSGSGKSTLLHILGFLDRPDAGLYQFASRETTALTDDTLAKVRNRFVGFIFQQFHLLPRLSVLENVQLPLIYTQENHPSTASLDKIKQLGLLSRLSHRAYQLSGGEQQRAAIARCLVNNPLLILADEPTGNLDTKNKEVIISIFKELHRQGKTLILVTHESDVARGAQRIIQMCDGLIISDEVVAQNRQRASLYFSKQEIEQSLLPGKIGLAQWKTILLSHLKEAGDAIFSRKMRSILSMLGILISTTAMIAILALGAGARANITEKMASLGSNLVVIRSGVRSLGGVALEAGSVTRLTPQDAEAIAQLAQVKNVTPYVRGRAQVVYGPKNWNTLVQGTAVSYPVMRNALPVSGRFFTAGELQSRQKVVILGSIVAEELFGERNPIGEMIKIDRKPFQVIGVLPEKGMVPWSPTDDSVMIPITTAMYRVLGKDYIDDIDVELKDAALTGEAKAAIRDLLLRRHRLDPTNEEAFQLRDLTEIQKTMVETNRTMTLLLSSIAVISLVVGGIGIMNIMLVSVTERIREIGLRKAMGARRRDILIQFLIEAMVITFLGGIIGIILGVFIVLSLGTILGWLTKVTVFAVFLTTVFSIVVGVISGLWPAYQASRLNPVDALRYE